MMPARRLSARQGSNSCLLKPGARPHRIATRLRRGRVNQPALTSAAPSDTPSSSPNPKPSGGILGAIKRFFVGDQVDKAKLAALGMGAFASYAVISNVTYGVCVTLAWLAFVKQTGLSPLAPGQWKGFLAFYAGLWTMQNFARPLRFSLALALAPTFERVIGGVSSKTGLPKQGAFVVLLGGIAAVTASGLFGALALLGGFPPAPVK